MRPVAAWLLVALLAVATGAAFLAPWTVAAGLAAACLLVTRKRRGLASFAVVAVVFDAVLLAVLRPTGTVLQLGPLSLGSGGALLGVQAALRLVAGFGVNVAVLERVPPARLLDGLRLPPRAAGFVAAVLIAAQDLGRDFAALRDARRSQGRWPEGRWGAARAAAGVLPVLMVHAVRRAEVRRDALRLAGVPTGSLFAPVVAVTALGAAGRLAFVGLPNVALTYAVVFLGGLVFGARVGFWGGVWCMALTNLVLSGLLPSAYVNVPAMGLLGLLGAALRGLDLSGGGGLDRGLGRAIAAMVGILATFLFSAAADAAAWLLVPEFRGGVDVLRVQVVWGLLFNVVPALVNAVVFAAAVVPVHDAFRALRSGGRGGDGVSAA